MCIYIIGFYEGNLERVPQLQVLDEASPELLQADAAVVVVVDHLADVSFVVFLFSVFFSRCCVSRFLVLVFSPSGSR